MDDFISETASVVDNQTAGTRHLYRRGRTLCGGRWYKTGYAPCELGRGQRLWDTPALRKASDEDIQALADILGMAQCWSR